MDGDGVHHVQGEPKGHSIYRRAAHPQAAVAYPGWQDRDIEHLSACRRRDPVLRSVCRAPGLGKYYFTDGNNLERSYRDSLSGFREWRQLGHAKDWVLLPDNMGERLGINETSLHDDLFTFLTNKVYFFRNL